MSDFNPSPHFACPALADVLDRLLEGEAVPTDELRQPFAFLPVVNRTGRD